MSKKIKVLFLTILVCFIGSFISCTTVGGSNLPDDSDVSPVNLTTPLNVEVLVENEMINVSFVKVSNASSYTIRVYTSLRVLVTSTTISSDETELNLLVSNYKNGNYYLTVSANGDGEKYFDSPSSEKINFEINNGQEGDPTKLDAPSKVGAEVTDGKVTVSYTSVLNANGYKIIIKNSNNKEVVTAENKKDVLTKVFDINAFEDGTYKVVVIALGDKTSYLDSDESSATLFEVKSGNGGGGDIIDGDLSDYYKSVEGLTGSALKKSLRSLITTTHKKITSYDDCKKYLPHADEDLTNSKNMILFYTGESIKKSTDVNNDWNREHVWPKSLGWYKNSGAGADLHHIRPCSIPVNSARGNIKFGIGSSYYTPNDDYKGDVARIIFYMMTRYSQSDSYDFTSVAQSKALLLEWNKLDPVSPQEVYRNEYIYKIQGNRNPFIDYPEFVDMIWG